MKYKELPFHPKQEEIVDIMCDKTGTDDRNFFRVMVAYKFAEMSSSMRATVEFVGTKGIPTNMYALDLAPSGYSKNASMNILEKDIFRKFKDKFMLKTYKDVSSRNLSDLAGDYSTMMGLDIGDAQRHISKEFESLPKFLYSFGSSTDVGFKALRTKLSMAGIGATSNILDEIGSNLQGNAETFTVQLEAYDMGDGKQKLIKGDSNSDMRGSVPSNLFAFGTHAKLLDGCATEKQFFEMLDTGYARRFVVGFVENHKRKTEVTAEEMYDSICNPMVETKLIAMAKDFEDLADDTNYGLEFTMSKDTALELIQYRLHCDKIAEDLKEHEEIKRAVIKHGYWRALKIAGAYAFVDGSGEVTKEHIDNAIALIEVGNECFDNMLKREKPYVRLAKYVSDIGRKITQVDLVEDLPFYKGSESQKRELMNLATAYGYQNNIVIKKTFKDGIEFLEGEKLETTDLEKVCCSWSKDIATGYKPACSDFHKIHQLVSDKGFEYCNHSFKDGHRKAENAIKGFNLLILDMDSGLPINVCKTLLKDYKFFISTTKRHTESHNRYRIILPMSHKLYLDSDEYKKFMQNVFEWLPFEADEQTKDIARKWSSHKGEYLYNDGKLIDVLQFIPDTPKEAEHKKFYSRHSGVENLQRWFLLNNREESGRNNCLRDYALALLDNGMNADNIRHSVYDLNEKFTPPLPNNEIESTVMKTVIKKEYEMELSNS